MFPGRLWVALGTGEASNEHITGDRWPSKPNATPAPGECVDVIRRLHAGEQVSHDGRVRWTGLASGPSPTSRRG